MSLPAFLAITLLYLIHNSAIQNKESFYDFGLFGFRSKNYLIQIRAIIIGYTKRIEGR